MITPKADWQKNTIVLVDPGIWPRYAKGSRDLRPAFRELVGVLRNWNVRIEELGRKDAPLDIWIRDWGFVDGTFFRYAPNYAPGYYNPAAVRRARSALVRRLRMRCGAMPLVLDGGNLVHNGTVAIVTEKVFRENAHLSCGEIERAIASMGFERVVFIPNEPGDEIGHADGMCRFASKGVLLVNDYSGALRLFGRRLRRILGTAKPGAEMVSLPWFSRGERIDSVPSAVGCYMNFLHIAHGMIVPAFGHHKDEAARRIIASLAERSVVSLEATRLARLGGVFNCVSLTF